MAGLAAAVGGGHGGSGCLDTVPSKGGVKLGTAKVGGGHGGIADECPDPAALQLATPAGGENDAAAAGGCTDGMRGGATIALLACGAAGACT